MARKTIALLGPVPVINEEDMASESITPGHLVEFTAGGLLQRNDTINVVLARAFALEREELGKGIDDAYASGDYVKIGSFHPGQRVYAFLASGQCANKGDYLTPTTEGQLKVAASGTGRIARALELTDATAGTSRVRAEIV